MKDVTGIWINQKDWQGNRDFPKIFSTLPVFQSYGYEGIVGAKACAKKSSGKLTDFSIE